MIGECMNYIGFIVVSNTLGIDTNHELGNPEKKTNDVKGRHVGC